ncbi:MAG: hypothetical protein MZU91_04980 [Desulfosudis oleivorans]|nr:hypothetical protein [Desulfosudis oleivorans]
MAEREGLELVGIDLLGRGEGPSCVTIDREGRCDRRRLRTDEQEPRGGPRRRRSHSRSLLAWRSHRRASTGLSREPAIS